MTRLLRQSVIILLIIFAAGRSPAVEQRGETRVACVGDSITYGYEINDREVNSYPVQLQKLLGEGFEVANFGLSGARISQKTRKPYKDTSQHKAALAFAPHVVIICLGVNDTSLGEWQRNKRHFMDDYKDLIRDFQNVQVDRPVKVILGTLTPVVPPYEPYIAIGRNIREADSMIRQVAVDLGLPLVDLFSRLNAEPAMFPDGLHPNADGAKIIAETVYSAITGDHGGLKMPWVFGDHMVLQRDVLIPVFGTADVGSVVTVGLGPNTERAVADQNGRWRADMPAVKAGGPYRLTCSDESRTLAFSDIMIGEVWLASGQSNMDWPMSRDSGWTTEGPAADKYPEIRLLNRQGNPSGGADKWTEQQIRNLTVDDY